MTKILMIAAIVLYMALVLWIGFAYAKKNSTTTEFYLGNRGLGPFVTAMSAEASDMSSWLLLGVPGVALLVGGFAEAFWTTLGLAVGTYFNWLIVSRRIRLYSEKTGSDTFPDFLSNRFRDKSGFIVAASAIIIIVFFVPYTGSGFAAIGKLFNSLFGMDYHLGMLIGAAIIVLYTITGGFLAVSTTDFVQSIVMTIALFVVVAFGLSQAGGTAKAAESLRSLGYVASLTGDNGSYGFLPIVSTLAWGLGYFGMPHILLRFMAIKDVNKLKLSRRIATVWVVISMGVAILIGMLGLVYANNTGIINEAGFDSERIIIYMSDAIANINPVLAVVAGVILAGILAATMSTADSQLLAASSSVSENIVHRFIKKDMTAKGSMWLSRIAVCCIAIIAAVFAWNPDSSVFRIVSFAWAGFGAAFGPLVLFSLFWKRTNRQGAIAGIISGGVMVFVWKFLVRPLGGGWDLYELLPAFIVSGIFIVVVSLLTAAPSKEITDEFEAVDAAVKAK